MSKTWEQVDNKYKCERKRYSAYLKKKNSSGFGKVNIPYINEWHVISSKDASVDPPFLISAKGVVKDATNPGPSARMSKEENLDSLQLSKPKKKKSRRSCSSSEDSDEESRKKKRKRERKLTVAQAMLKCTEMKLEFADKKSERQTAVMMALIAKMPQKKPHYSLDEKDDE